MKASDNSIDQYVFESNDFVFYLKRLFKDRGFKALYQLFNRPHRRPYSRSLIKKYAPNGLGLEIGVGARTIAPTTRTVLSDAHSEHGIHDSIAKVFFKGDEITYPENTFSFVLSEHVLEHIPNPIAMLKEWIRVLKPKGKILLFLPHHDRTNDYHRDITPLSHLIEDFKNNPGPDDQVHFDDWMTNVVEKGLMPDHYKHLSKEELLKTYSIHYHTWTEKEIIELFEYLELKVLFYDNKVFDRRDSFVVIGEKA